MTAEQNEEPDWFSGYVKTHDQDHHELENSHWKFIGTIQMHNGDLIFHLFEKEEIQVEH